MSEAIRVLVADDFESDRQVFTEVLSRKGCIVDSAPDYNQALAKLTSGNYDVILIDLKMPDKTDEENPKAGVALLREIRVRRIRVGAIVLTGHPSMNSLKEVEQLGISSYLVKDRLLGIMDLEQGAEELYKEVTKAATKRMSEQGAEELYKEVTKAAMKRVPPEEVERILQIGPFDLTYTAYQKLDSRGVAEVQGKAHEAKDEWAFKKLKEEGARWLVLCGDQVAIQSADLQALPKPDELDKIGQEKDRVPFLFVRLSDEEEVCRLKIPWRQVDNSKDYYPTVDVKVKGNGKEIMLHGEDFDTGSADIHLSLEHLLEEGIITEQDIARCRPPYYIPERPMHGINTPCYLHSVAIGVTSDCKPVMCELIEDWNKSGFCEQNRKRKALVGRSLLLQLRVRLELDGANGGVTRVLPPENTGPHEKGRHA
jgi:CheY-like chemotaxis protein